MVLASCFSPTERRASTSTCPDRERAREREREREGSLTRPTKIHRITLSSLRHSPARRLDTLHNHISNTRPSGKKSL